MKRWLQREDDSVTNFIRHAETQHRQIEKICSFISVPGEQGLLYSSEKQFWLQLIRTEGGSSENAVGWIFGL
jgi:hypothetical protein